MVEVGGREFQFSALRHVEMHDKQLGVSKNRGGPHKSSILIGFSIINHPFWGLNTPIFGLTPTVATIQFSNFLKKIPSWMVIEIPVRWLLGPMVFSWTWSHMKPVRR